ncbi:hypothetical protein [Streptomyces anulatus]|uniref:hypothetical protein n=1 Tax=Streptomyces anulatus TaxID=1892 RepID=UPI002256050C|nr:hypothetical protein [Streptomyces anulatus]MCX4504554.1 hypothetical protein [Streptomyces anulatus]
MLHGKNVIAWTPYGRRDTYSILIQYLKRDVERGIVDEVWAYMNTDPIGQEDDIAYAHQLDAQYDWFRIVTMPDGVSRRPGPKQRNTGFAYRYMLDPNTVYLRFDDDIVYIHEDAITNLVEKRLEMPHATAVFATTWNNAIVSWFGQQAGVIPKEFGEVGPFCMDPMGWANGQFAVDIHRLLLDHVEKGTVEELYMYQDFPIRPGTQFSVSCFASQGSLYASLPHGPGVLVPDEEEHWHTVHQPQVTGQPNILIGNAIVSHYTFFPQRGIVCGTDILDRYRALADRL